MGYDFSSRLDYCGTRMKDLQNETITYTRDSTDLEIENVTPEESDAELLQSLGISLLREKWQDFVFDTSELSDFTLAEPKEGDKIVWGDYTFMLAAIGDELFKYVTSTRKRIRIHTKQIG